MIYLDNASTKPVHRVCIDAINEVLRENWGNPSSLHGLGIKAKQGLDEDRKTVAGFINAKPHELIFTSGGCEANSLALSGFIRYYAPFMRYHVPGSEGVTLITTPIEHKSIGLLAKYFESEYHTVRYVKCDMFGRVDIEDLEGLLKDANNRASIPLVSVHFANSEIGTVQDIKNIAAIVHKYDGIIHTDATQATCSCKIDVKKLGVDMLSFSGQKMGAPKGIGVLYKKEDIKIFPLIYGTQEFNLRGGTENTAYIHALACLIKSGDFYFKNEGISCYFYQRLCEKGVSVKLLGHPTQRLSNHVSLIFIELNKDDNPVVSGEALLYYLESKGIYVSTGSACNSRSHDTAYISDVLGINDKFQHSVLRFTFDNLVTKEQIDIVVDAIVEGIDKMREW